MRPLPLFALMLLSLPGAIAAQERTGDSVASLDSVRARIDQRISPTNVTTVGADELTRTPVWSVEQALQGKVPGAMITQNSGAPGGGLTVRLGGVGTLVSRFTPLYVVDGIIASDISIPPGTNFITQASPGTGFATAQENAMNRIGDLRVEDIESVDVLKGAAAAAIYGSKGSSGVVVITTKRGRTGHPRFSVRQTFGVSRISKQLGVRTFDPGDTAGVRAVWGQPGVNAFIAANGLANPTYFNHEMETFGNTPLSNQTSASVSGGGQSTRYYASVLSQHDGGIMSGTFADKQGLRLNIDQSFQRASLSISSSVNRVHDDRGLVNNDNNGSSAYDVIAGTPAFFDVRPTCPDGSRRTQCESGIYPVNPFVGANNLQTTDLFQNRETVWRFIGSAWLTVDLVKSGNHELQLLGGGGTDRFKQQNHVLSPAELQFEPLDGLLGTSVKSSSSNHNETQSASLKYSHRSATGAVVRTHAGIQHDSYDLQVNRKLDANLVANTSSGTVGGVDNEAEERGDLGAFGQAEILVAGERLLITAGARGDRSTNNGDQSKFYWYPNAGMSFRFLWTGFLEELKVRGAVGTSGNEPLYGQTFTEVLPFSSGSQTSVLQPERQLEIETGFDANAFKGRARLNFTAYQRRITNLIVARTLPVVTGFTSQISNGGSLRNRGLEISLSAIPVRARTVELNTRASIWLNRCTVTSLSIPPFPASGVRHEQGKSCTQFWGNDSLGRLPGDDALGIPGSRIVRYLVDINPAFNLTFANDLRFHALRFYALIDHQHGGYHLDGTRIEFDARQTSVDYITPRSPGQLSGLQRRTLSTKCSLCAGLQKSSYVKLREASVSLDVPESIVRKVWGSARQLRFSVIGRNLWTITPYPGTDPESTQTPASLGSSAPSEFLGYPASRSVWFSVDLGF